MSLGLTKLLIKSLCVDSAIISSALKQPRFVGLVIILKINNMMLPKKYSYRVTKLISFSELWTLVEFHFLPVFTCIKAHFDMIGGMLIRCMMCYYDMISSYDMML